MPELHPYAVVELEGSPCAEKAANEPIIIEKAANEPGAREISANEPAATEKP
jgi:hypothetical protein